MEYQTRISERPFESPPVNFAKASPRLRKAHLP